MTRWQRFGKDRLYVTAPDGSPLGWHDLATGATHYATADAALLDATVARWRAQHGHVGRSELVGVVPSPAASPEGRRTASSADGPSTPRPEPAADEDLTLRPPGQSLADRLTELDAQAASAQAPARYWWAELDELRAQDRLVRAQSPLGDLLRGLVGRRRPERQELRDLMREAKQEARRHEAAAAPTVRELAAEAVSWQRGLDGELVVGQLLAEVVRRDPRWRVLHSVPVGSRGADIDHVLVGPGGVLTLKTKHHPSARVFVANDAVLVNGTRYPYVRNARHEAQRAERLLTAAVGRRVVVEGVVVVRAQDLTVRAQPADVHVLASRRLVRWLRARPEVLAADEVDAVFAAARRASTWRA
ncbi:nuclease-related domain-containing protein [Cellulomonas massiliensis]|uniref:nuclease-related domain-containing protein n=1 Tax=Cellulomonas massiliensis TaxID=1465811 RepID=UPI001C9CBA18|nr:nuclease-related domain-containing protein [Cellulomonas massiliensis]